MAKSRRAKKKERLEKERKKAEGAKVKTHDKSFKHAAKHGGPVHHSGY